jgi:hypothetical protein
MAPIILWFVLRFLTSILAGMISSIKPLAEIEKSISFSTERHRLWFNRAFLSPWMRWDAEWYQNRHQGTRLQTVRIPSAVSWLATHYGRMYRIQQSVSALAGLGLFFCFYCL